MSPSRLNPNAMRRVPGRGVQQRRNDGETLLLTVVVPPREVGEAILDD
jgi:hypothetical protein